MLEDQFFFRTGLEVVYLEIVFTELNMTQDPEYQQMQKEHA